MSKKTIYYLEILLAYRKGKSMVQVESWCVSTYTSPSDIVRNDKKTMDRLNQHLYGKSYKSQRRIAILDVISKKAIGTTNNLL